MLGIWLIRRFVPATREGFDAEVSSQMLGVVASLFGLLLAFVIVIEYQNFGSAQDNVGQEADSLAAITRDSDALAPAEGARVRAAIGTYVRAVVDDEWPRLRDGHDSAQAWSDVNLVYAALQAARPTSPQATAFYNDSVKQLNSALIARRGRLESAAGGLPVPGLDAHPARRVHHPRLRAARRVTQLLVPRGRRLLDRTRVALSLVVLVDLSYPFSGSLDVSSSPFQTGALAQFFHQ